MDDYDFRLEDNDEIDFELLDRVFNDFDLIEHRNKCLKNMERKESKMMYLEEFGYVIGDENSIAYRVAREGYQRMISEREKVLRMVRENPYSFMKFDYLWRDDKMLAMEAVVMDGMLLEYVSEDLKGDKDVVWAAINSNLSAIKFASNMIRDDYNIMLYAVSNNGLLLEYASNRIKNDKGITMAAVKNDGRAINYVSDMLKGDRDIVLSAICQNGSVLLKVGREYLSDKEAVMMAVSQNAMSYLLMVVDKKFLDDEDVLFAAYKYDKKAIKYASDRVKDKYRVMLIESMANSLFQFDESDKVKKYD